MCGPAALPLAIIGSAAIGAGASIYQGAQQRKAAKKAAKQAKRDAADQKAANDRAFNAENQKQPDLAGLYQMNRDRMSGGVGSTMLTGPGGGQISPSLLERRTLLGS